MSEKAVSVYCLEVGLEPACAHDFQQAVYPALAPQPPVTGTQSLNFSSSVTLPWGFRLYCRRCGGFRDWPQDSGVYRREVE